MSDHLSAPFLVFFLFSCANYDIRGGWSNGRYFAVDMEVVAAAYFKELSEHSL
jgi:hypothetical protein